MYLISYFFLAVAQVLNILLSLFMWIIVAKTILSWVSPDPLNPLVRIIHNLTDPIIKIVRSKIPVFYGGIDFSPMIIFLFVLFLKAFVINSLTQAARSLM